MRLDKFHYIVAILAIDAELNCVLRSPTHSGGSMKILTLLMASLFTASIAKATSPENLGSGYVCNAQFADGTQLKIYFTNIVTNRYDGKGKGRLIVDNIS